MKIILFVITSLAIFSTKAIASCETEASNVIIKSASAYANKRIKKGLYPLTDTLVRVLAPSQETANSEIYTIEVAMWSAGAKRESNWLRI